MGGTQSVHFLSHCIGGQLKLFVLKSPEQLQHLANIFVRPSSLNERAPPRLAPANTNHLHLDRMEMEIRRLQLHALKSWLELNGSIDPPTMEELFAEVAHAIIKDAGDRFSAPNGWQAQPECRDFSEAELLKWKLEKMEKKTDGTHSQMLKPTGKTITVDVAHLLRSFTRNKAPTIRSPSKNASANVKIASRLKPSCDLETARSCTDWPQCTQLKYHGIK